MGNSNYRYEVVEDWARLPPGWSFRDVAGLASDSKDNIYVFHRGEHPLIKFDRDGNLLGGWGDGIFSMAHSIRVGPDGILYCVDYGDHTIRKVSPEGEILKTLGTPNKPSATGVEGLDYRTIKRVAGPFNRPTDVAFGPNGDVLISDGYGNARIHTFSKEGELITSWGQPGMGPVQFHLPHGIWVDQQKRLLVADRENSRIQFLTLDGQFISEWRGIERPAAILVDGNQSVFIVEMGYNPGSMFPNSKVPAGAKVMPRVTIRALSGVIESSIGGPRMTDPGNFYAPHAICMDSRQDVYIGEVNFVTGAPPGCHTLQKFKRVH